MIVLYKKKDFNPQEWMQLDTGGWLQIYFLASEFFILLKVKSTSRLLVRAQILIFETLD